MPDILIISSRDQEVSRINKIAKTEGFRTKVTSDIKAASNWVLARPFDLVVASDEYDDNAIEKLSSSLWTTNNNGQFTVYSMLDLDPIDLSRKRWALGVLGVEFTSGSEVFEQLAGTVKKIGERKLRAGAKFRVMVVEDLASPRDIICAFIEHLEYAYVKGFPSGKDALIALRTEPASYSCIITDVSMPGMNGWELCAEVRGDARLSHIPIIVLTAYGTPDILMKCLKAGASGFLVKPPSKAHLSRELSRAKRIIFDNDDPRLIKSDDMDVVQEILEEKGYI